MRFSEFIKNGKPRPNLMNVPERAARAALRQRHWCSPKGRSPEVSDKDETGQGAGDATGGAGWRGREGRVQWAPRKPELHVICGLDTYASNYVMLPTARSLLAAPLWPKAPGPRLKTGAMPM